MAGVATTGRDELTGLDSALIQTIISISQEYDKEERDERNSRTPFWLKLENYFDGLQRRYWSAVAHDWRRLPSETDESSRHYDKIINVYRGHAESIIAALSIRVPGVVFYPEDADVIEDVDTAKTCTKIKKLIEKHNNGKLMLIKALLTLYNTGVVAAYIYNRRNNEYGTYQKPTYSKEPISVTTVNLNCAECGNNIDEVIFKNEPKKITEEIKECQVCGYQGIPNQEEYNEQIPQITGFTNESKSRTAIELFSPLFVHIPFYARKQELIPYLCLKFEQHYSLLKHKYPKLAKKGLPGRADADSAEEHRVDISNKNLVTVECWWVRNWGMNLPGLDEDNIKKLQEKYPDGYYAVIIDGQVIEIKNENLDEHWQISSNPLSEYLHAQPIGKPMAPIQDIKNEIVDLQIETFEHAIPETHARADVVDFEKYGKSEARPGMMYPAMTPSDGSPLGNAFHTLKTATLSEENDLFNKRLDNEAQFALGDYPSIYGGPATSGSKTAREYEQSRAMALQRLGLIWTIVQNFWAPMMGKAVQLNIHALRKTNQDEKFVEREKGSLNYMNVWIRQADMAGKIGRVEPDIEEDLPQSSSQLKDVIVQLLSLKDERVNNALMHPQNTPLIIKALGAPEFFIPDSDSRDKQYAEFAEMLQGVPVVIDMELDDHIVEAEVCATMLRSEDGRALDKINPEGKALIKEHYLAHIEAINLKAQQQMVKQPATPAAEGAIV